MTHGNWFLFKFGIPKPRRCELPDKVGRVDGIRVCVSDQGVIRQRITEWDAGRSLGFEMVETNIGFYRWVASLKDHFSIESAGTSSWVTRSTEVRFRGWMGVAMSWATWVGLKVVHYYVFQNWRLTLGGT